MIVKQVNRPKNSVGNFPQRFKCLMTELAPNTNARDVLLHNFGGKPARHPTERQLGPWTEM